MAGLQVLTAFGMGNTQAWMAQCIMCTYIWIYIQGAVYMNFEELMGILLDAFGGSTQELAARLSISELRQKPGPIGLRHFLGAEAALSGTVR